MHLSDWVQRIDLGKEIQEVYLHSFLFKLGIKLVSIFLPLYILELGYSIEMVVLFFMTYYGGYLFFSLINAKIVSKVGYKHASLLASPFILLFYLGLRNLSGSGPSLYIMALLGGFAFNLYWTGMNPEVASSSHSEDREKETGFFFSMPSLASIFSPVVGGLILAVFGFPTLFLFTASIVGSSFLPFLFSDEHRDGMDYSILEFISEAELRDFATFAVKGANSIAKKVLWPLYLAVVLQGSVNIGGAGSFLSLGSAFTSVMIGKLLTESNRTLVITGGTAVASLSYLLMSLVTEPTAAFMISALNGLSYTAISIPIYSKAMDHSEQSDVIEYFALREIALSIGRVSALLILLGVISFLPQAAAFRYGFVFFAAVVIIIGFMGSRMD
ncbi:MAG: MFS transporter [Nanohaloarchaea archaeon]|nr:MFS transporter [Candidatus Nanohaloarchaea archaeon]